MKENVNYMHPLDVIDIIKADTGKKYKEEQLHRFRNNAMWLKTCKYAYDPGYTFGVKKIHYKLEQIYNKCYWIPTDRNTELEEMFSLLDKLAKRELTGGMALGKIKIFIDEHSGKTSELLYWIIKRDLKIGCNSKSINKAYGDDVVHKPAYMGAVNYDPKKVKALFKKGDGTVFAENKADGLYGNVIVNQKKGEWYIESRAGHIIYGMDNIVNDIVKNQAQFLTDSYVLNGEILVSGYDRMTANGIVNAIKSIYKKEANGENNVKDIENFKEEHGITVKEAQELLYMEAWDVITLDEYKQRHSSTPRYQRLENLEYFAQDLEKVKVIEYIKTDSYDEVLEFFADRLSKGFEGLIVKTSNGVWKDGKPSHQVKMKLEFVSDLKIIGFNEGKEDTKYHGMLGSAICESEEGGLKTDVSGWNDKERLEIWLNKEKYLGKVIGVKCNGLSKSDDNEHYSMMYANVNRVGKEIDIRDDKTEANTLEEIIAIENSKKYGV